MWRSSASSWAPGFGSTVVHFRLVIVLCRCCFFPVRIAVVQLTSAWSVKSMCSTRASGICVKFFSIKSRHLAKFALIRIGSPTTLTRERIELAEWRLLRLWSVNQQSSPRMRAGPGKSRPRHAAPRSGCSPVQNKSEGLDCCSHMPLQLAHC